MRRIHNSETEPSEMPAPEESGRDAYDAPTRVGPMSAAIAQLIEAERERAEADDTREATQEGRDKDSTKSGVRPAITDSEPSHEKAEKVTSARLPMLHNDEGIGEYEPTLLNPMAMELLGVKCAVSEPDSGSSSEGVDVVASIIREMEAAAGDKGENESEPAIATSGSSPPSKRPSVPRPKSAAISATRPTATPVLARPQASNVPTATTAMSSSAPVIASAVATNVTTTGDEKAASGSQSSEQVDPTAIPDGRRRNLTPRIAFPEWVGISVRAADLVGDRPGPNRRQTIRIVAGVGVITVVVGVVWWLLSLF
jgi:hypothetical protein